MCHLYLEAGALKPHHASKTELLGFRESERERERERELGAAKSTVWYIQRKKRRTGERRNVKGLDIQRTTGR